MYCAGASGPYRTGRIWPNSTSTTNNHQDDTYWVTSSYHLTKILALLTKNGMIEGCLPYISLHLREHVLKRG